MVTSLWQQELASREKGEMERSSYYILYTLETELAF